MLYRAKLEQFLPGQPMLVIEKKYTTWFLFVPFTTYIPVAKAILRGPAIELTEMYDVGHDLLSQMSSTHWQAQT